MGLGLPDGALYLLQTGNGQLAAQAEPLLSLLSERVSLMCQNPVHQDKSIVMRCANIIESVPL